MLASRERHVRPPKPKRLLVPLVLAIHQALPHPIQTDLEPSISKADLPAQHPSAMPVMYVARRPWS